MIVATADSEAVQRRALDYERASYIQLASGVDRMMAWLLGIEWIGMVVLAFVNAPYTWQGAERHWSPHFLAAVLAGPAFIGPSIALALNFPGRILTRHCVAVAQMLVSVLLIDITGGRIETHFHVFVSLAFLAFYRDWRVLFTASAVAAADHLVRGFWWPQAIYGITTVSPYRWLEHVLWVIFEDFILFLAIHKAEQESKAIARGNSLLYQGAYHDVLTGLSNRRQLSESFAELIQANPSTPNAVMFVDLDRFKQVNDIHGHTVGDKLLLQVATRLTNCLAKDGTIARIGGDEFIIVLHEATEAKANEIGSLVLHSITQPFSVGGLDLFLSATVGVAIYPDHGFDLAILQERADQAMYAAKAAGRNQIQIYTVTAFAQSR